MPAVQHPECQGLGAMTDHIVESDYHYLVVSLECKPWRGDHQDGGEAKKRVEIGY
ncbi:hypothetical protein D3C85_1353800 [compost metagenome]